MDLIYHFQGESNQAWGWYFLLPATVVADIVSFPFLMVYATFKILLVGPHG